MQILVTAASQRLNITDPMTVDEFTNADTDAPASEQITDNWEQQLVDAFVTGTRDAYCDEDMQEDTHVAAEPTTEPDRVSNKQCSWGTQVGCTAQDVHVKQGLDVAYEHSVNVE